MTTPHADGCRHADHGAPGEIEAIIRIGGHLAITTSDPLPA